MSSAQPSIEPTSLSPVDWLVLAIVGLTPLIISNLAIFPQSVWEHHPFHAVVEGLGSFAAVIVAAAMIMLMRQGDIPRAQTWVIGGLIGMGILDGFHAATHAGHVFVWLHSTATFVGGLLFACVWLPDAFHRRVDAFALAMLAFATATVFAVASIAMPDWLPAMKGEAGFTFTAKALNVGGGIGFLAAACYFVLRQGKTRDGLLFANLSLLFGVAGIIFEKSVLWDSNWWLWHILRLAAYTVVLYFFMSIYYRTLLSAHMSSRALEQQVHQISQQKAEHDRARKELETILNSTADAIISVDPEGLIKLYNARARQLFGFDRTSVIGNTIAKLFTPASREQHDRLLQRCRQGDTTPLGQEHQLEGCRASGETFPVALRVTEMRLGDEHQFVELIQDVTSRKQAEVERVRLFDAIRETVQHLTVASSEILASMATQTGGAERQASESTETMSAVTSATRAAGESAKIATDVADTARRADVVGQSGRRAIEETRESIDTVHQHVNLASSSISMLAARAQAIGDIISAMDNIAEQTKVLALNAAVEASRAGEAGKGFSVVAAEVKSLAVQAKSATKQVRNILKEIQEATEEAVRSTEQGTVSMDSARKVVANAEKTIDELGLMVSEAAQAAARIVAASSQQSVSMHRIADSMNEIDQAANQTLVATRQTVQAASDLDSLGKRLERLMETDI